MQENNKKVLIVDDEADLRLILKYIMEKEGFQVREAVSGRDCLDKISLEFFPVVFMDLMMPEISGEEAFIALKEKYPDTEVIIITAYGSTKKAIELYEKGIFSYLQKPFNKEEVTANARRAYEKYLLTAENRQLKIQKMLSSAQNSNQLLKALPCVVSINNRGQITGISQEICGLLEYSSQELLDSSFGIIFDRDFMVKRLPELLAQEHLEKIEFIFITKSNLQVKGGFSGKILWSNEGIPYSISGTFLKG